MPTGGRLRSKAVLEKRADIADGGGGVTTTWIAESAFWVEIKVGSLGEEVVASAIRDKVTARIICRKRSDITPQKRLRVEGSIYEILATSSADSHGAWMVCLCEQTG